ncbi:MAG TPA: phosphate ABC transporter substrate-binding protein PstS [Acidimicrobiales bacterium]|nr:phosphate ABC transporter substrate-binding protein PstS [Acidimicrobiales bacterium]
MTTHEPHPRRRFAGLASPVAALVALAMVATACGTDETDEATPDGAGQNTVTTVREDPINATLNASGATFPKAFYDMAIDAYRRVQPGVTVNYAGGGSGQGRNQLRDGVVDFAGSDGIVREEDKASYRGGEFLYVPTVAAPITISYNLPDVRDLQLDADTIARIFQRQITKWDHPTITALNAGVRLPSSDITVAHRSDGSGTTEQFTRYLDAAAPGVWTLRFGSTVEWPSGTQAGNGNQGVAQIVRSTAGAVGYVDLSDALAVGLQVARVKNKAGRLVGPTLEAASAALAGARVNADLTYNPLNADGADAYPITAPTWILVYKNQTDRNKALAVKSFLRFVLTTGQTLARDVDYAALAPSLQERALAQVESIVVPGA